MTGSTQLRPADRWYKGLLLAPMIRTEAVDKAMTLDLREGDVLVASYPKTGTMWLSELLWLLRNKADIEGSNSRPLSDRCIPTEMTLDHVFAADLLTPRPRPWLASSHLPANLLRQHVENNVKIVIPFRNPKDTLVSFYHFYKLVPIFDFSGTWDEFFQKVKDKQTFGGDYFEWYESWLPYLDRPNIKLVTYEDMKDDLRSVMTDVASFLDVAPSGADIEKMLAHLSFDAMKANKGGEIDQLVQIEGALPEQTEGALHEQTEGALPQQTNCAEPAEPSGSYFRKGAIGDWKNYFSDEQQIYVEQRYAQTGIEKFVSTVE